MPVLLTGATGFLGSYLARTLIASGETVRAIKRPASDLRLLGSQAQQIEWVEVDLFDPMGLEQVLEGVNTVYHCAAVVSFSSSDRDLMMKVNVEGTANLVNASLEAGVQAFLHVSSVAAVGRRKGLTLIDENQAWENNALATDYALSKHLAEREAWRGWAEGLPVVVVNPGTILGAGFWDRGTARFFSRADEGIRFYTDGATGFVDVRDVAAACIMLIKQQAFGERYILVGENAAYRRLFSEICQALDRPVPGIHAGPALLELVWRWEALKARLTGGKPDLTRQNARVLGHSYPYDNQKVTAQIGLKFRGVSESVADIFRCYLNSKNAVQSFGLMEPDLL